MTTENPEAFSREAFTYFFCVGGRKGEGREEHYGLSSQ